MKEYQPFTAGLEFGQGNNQKPPPKIRGSQFVKREEKVKPKLTIRNPYIQKTTLPKPK